MWRCRDRMKVWGLTMGSTHYCVVANCVCWHGVGRLWRVTAAGQRASPPPPLCRHTSIRILLSRLSNVENQLIITNDCVYQIRSFPTLIGDEPQLCCRGPGTCAAPGSDWHNSADSRLPQKLEKCATWAGEVNTLPLPTAAATAAIPDRWRYSMVSHREDKYIVFHHPSLQ